jgi:signal transduction histidine kinase
MPDGAATHHYRALWTGFGFSLATVLCNAIFFLSPPGQQVIPWLSLLLAAAAMMFLVTGLKMVFTQPQALRAKVFSSILGVVALLLIGLGVLVFIRSRALPMSAEAPKIGEKAPDFALADTGGKMVTLDQLLAPLTFGSNSAAPKAVLLIFYRGYW